MAAYVISEVQILEEEAADKYRALAEASVGRYGGRYLARATEPEVVQGSPASGRFVIVEFPSMSAVHQWYSSPEYAQALAFRDRALRRRLLFVEGEARGAGEV